MVMKGIQSNLPDVLTGINIFIGFTCIILVMHASRTTDAFHQNYAFSAWLIVIAGLLDILDGAIARWFSKTGTFGIQFDSIADYTVFAVAPSILLYTFLYDGHSIFYATIPLVYLIAAAYRLARFNADALESSRKKIVGLGTPISAAIVVASLLLIDSLHQQGVFQEITWNLRYIMTILVLLNSLLMVSRVEFITAYEYCFRNIRRIIALLVLIFVPLLLLRFRLPSLSVLLVGVMYVVESLGRRLFLQRTSQTSNKD
jgi:CDP-diacylglycerol--serine O-phosphatidyltransferase